MRAGNLLSGEVEAMARCFAGLSGQLSRWVRRMTRRHPDILSAVGVGALFMASIAVAGSRQTVAGFTTTAVFSAVLLLVVILRWHWWLVAATATACALAAMLTGVSENTYHLYLAVVVLLFSLRSEMGAVILTTASVWGAFAMADAVTAVLRAGEDRINLEALPSILAAAALGQAVRANQVQRAMLVERARRAEDSRAEEARRQVQAERLRIARDLHDAVGHQVALISVQAGALTYLLDKDSDRARISLAHIQDASEAALEELRLSVGLLRQAGEHEPVEPAGRLSRLDELVAFYAAAGLPVTCTVTGAPRLLSDTVDLTAYRLIQESLTNAAKHAARSRTTVLLAFEPGMLRLTVENEGPVLAGPAAPSTTGRETSRIGHGIIGMHERAATLGGRLTAGPRAEGGFLVSAELPISGGVSR